MLFLPTFIVMPCVIKHRVYFFIWSIMLLNGCSNSDNMDRSNDNLEIAPNSGVYLVYENQGDLEEERDAINQVLEETFALINRTMPITNVEIKIFADPSQTIPEIGIGGFAPSGSEVHIYINKNFSELTQSIATELGPMLAHEMHHVKRWRTVGYGITLVEAIISEGLADWFSIEITGADPPMWSVAFTGEELENLLDLAKDTWYESPYDHPKWFFGTTSEIPRWAGYSLGYKLVGDYLSQYPNKKPSTLVDEPADSFVR